MNVLKQELSEASQEAMFEELFKAAAIGEEGSKQFQDAMNLLMDQEPDLAQQIQKLAQAAGTAGTGVLFSFHRFPNGYSQQIVHCNISLKVKLSK